MHDQASTRSVWLQKCMLRPLGAGVAGGGVGGAILQALFWGLEPAAIGDLGHCSGAPLHWGPAFDVPSLCAGILLGLALAQRLRA